MGLTIWNAIIAAGAALIGVFMGNRLQWRRELKKWQLEREAQRDRDTAQWLREDRHRFIEQKRLAYAEFLIAIENAERSISRALPALQAARKHETEYNGDEWIKTAEPIVQVQERYKETVSVDAHVSLLAPDQIRLAAHTARLRVHEGVLILTALAAISHEQFLADDFDESKTNALEPARQARWEVTEMMRADIATNSYQLVARDRGRRPMGDTRAGTSDDKATGDAETETK